MYTEKSLQKSEALEEIQEIITQAKFPCSRDDILKCAKDARAPRRIMDILKMLPDLSQKFWNVDEVIDRLSQLEINT